MTYTAFETYFWDRDDMLLDEADQDWYAANDEVEDMWNTAIAAGEDEE